MLIKGAFLFSRREETTGLWSVTTLLGTDLIHALSWVSGSETGNCGHSYPPPQQTIEPPTCYTTLAQAVTGSHLKRREDERLENLSSLVIPQKVCRDNFPLWVKKRKDMGRKVIEHWRAYFATNRSSRAESKCSLNNRNFFPF